MDEQKDGLVNTKGIRNVDSGWIDVTPVAASSAKQGDLGSRWAQYRVFSNGIVMMRGSILRNSGTWGNENVCSIPSHLSMLVDANLIFVVQGGKIVLVSLTGFFQAFQAGGLSVYFDGIIFSVY